MLKLVTMIENVINSRVLIVTLKYCSWFSMLKNNLRFRVVALLFFLLILGLTIQTFVVMSLSVTRSTHRELLILKSQLTEIINENSLAKDAQARVEQIFERVRGLKNPHLNCVLIGNAKELIADETFQCNASIKQTDAIESVINMEIAEIRSGKRQFGSLFYGDATKLITIPFQKGSNEIVALSVEISLTDSLKDKLDLFQLFLMYLLVNAGIFSVIGYFRIESTIIKPILQLVRVAESYSDEKLSISYSEASKSPFRLIGQSISNMLQRIKRDNEELQKSVMSLEEANEELQKNRLQIIKSEKLASVGRLSSGLAHEIGNPLSIILGYIELLKRDDVEGQKRMQFANKALEELNRVDGLIKEMLHFSRSRDETLESVYINEFVVEVVQFIKMEKRVKGCQLSLHLLDEDHSVTADINAIKQVLLNCIFNAADSFEKCSRKEQTIIVSVDLELEEDNKNLILTIEDNGEGISDETASLAFDPFFTTKDPGKGTGLGLFVCHMLVDKMDGDISIRPNQVEGTIVTIRVPVSDTIHNNKAS